MQKTFLNVHIPVIQFWFTQYVQYTAIYILPYAIYQYVEVGVLNCIALHCIAILLHIDIIVTALVGSSTRTIKTHSESSGALLSRWTCETRSAHTFVAHMACLFVIDTERQKFLDRLFDALTSEPPDTWPKTTHKLHIAALCGGFS